SSNATYSSNSTLTSFISRPNPSNCQLDFSSSSTNRILLHLFNPLSTTTQQYNNTFIANSTWTTLTISLRSDTSSWYLYAVYIYDQTQITGQNILLNGDYGTGTLYGWTIMPSTNPLISPGSYVVWTGSKILCQTFPTVIGNTYLIRYSMWSLSTTPYIIAAVTVGPYPLQTNTSSPLSTHHDSCVNQLLSIVHNIYKAFDEKQSVFGVFLDFAKAFDTVWHKGLLSKLEAKGIPPLLLQWFESYLFDRKIVTVVEGCFSSGKTINRGVPQGSVLGPLLFLIYIDDLCDNLVCDMKLFADDASLYRKGTDLQQMASDLNNDLVMIEKWSQHWKLSLNISKCEAMLFTLKPVPAVLPRLYIANNPVRQTTVHKHLGLLLTVRLDWTTHIDNILLRINKLIGLLKLHSRVLNRQALD
ncbi:unnamed protein product, partial [Didymodactylos carnosus]